MSSRPPMTPEERDEFLKLMEDKKNIKEAMPSFITAPDMHHTEQMKLLDIENRLQELQPPNIETL